MTAFLLLSMLGLAALDARMAVRSLRRADLLGCTAWSMALAVAVPAALYYAARLPA